MNAQSPCRDICMLAADRSHCTACLRSLAEIAGWASMTEAARQAVLDDLPHRSSER